MVDNNTVAVQLDYFYGMQSEMFSFLRIPKILIKDGRFEHLSNEAKMLFGLLLDRMSLSMKNRWFDDDDRVYIIYTTDEIMIDLNVGTQKCAKLLKELEAYGLIERKKQGFSKPDIIYVKNFATLVNDGDELPKEAEAKVKQWKDNKKRGQREEAEVVNNVNNVNNSSVLRKSKDESFENQRTTALKIKGRELRKSKDENFENRSTTDLKIEGRELRKSNPNNTNSNNTNSNNTNSSNTNISNTDYKYIDVNYNNTLTHSLSLEESADENGESEGESIYTIINKASNCEEEAINRYWLMQRYRSGELSELPDVDMSMTMKYGEYLESLSYSLYEDSRHKYKWSQKEAVDMAKEIFNLRLRVRCAYEFGSFKVNDKGLADTLICYMAEVIGLEESLIINGTRYSYQYMASKFFEIDEDILAHVVDTLKTSYSEVKNKKNYYISCLLNAKSHYEATSYEDLKTII